MAAWNSEKRTSLGLFRYPWAPSSPSSNHLCPTKLEGSVLTLKMTRMFSPSGSTFWKESLRGTALELK